MTSGDGDDWTDSPKSTSGSSGGGVLTGGIIMATLLSGLGRCARHADHFAHFPRGATRHAAEAFHLPEVPNAASGSVRMAPGAPTADEISRLLNVRFLREHSGTGTAGSRILDDFATAPNAASITDYDVRRLFQGEPSPAHQGSQNPLFNPSHLLEEMAKGLYHNRDRDDTDPPKIHWKQATIWDNPLGLSEDEVEDDRILTP